MAAGNIGFDADKLRTFACPTDAVSGVTPSGGSDVPTARKSLLSPCPTQVHASLHLVLYGLAVALHAVLGASIRVNK